MTRTTPIAVCLLLSWVVLSGPVPYTAPSGDLNLDGHVDTVDLQCEILIFTMLGDLGELDDDQCQSNLDCAALYGTDTVCRTGFTKELRCLPSCLHGNVPLGKDNGLLCADSDADGEFCLGTTQRRSADLNCDGKIGNEDFVFLIAIIMKSLGWPGTADYDGDGQLNFCDQDSDGDGDPDGSDCEILDHTISNITPEICNGIDEDCNGKVDDWLGTVSCGLSICAHEEPACVDGQPADCDEFFGALPETCNGVDDDCNSKTDDAPDEQLCAEFTDAPNVAAVSCLGGTCLTTACHGGFVDINGATGDGCECQEDLLEEVNPTCEQAQTLGILTDTDKATVLVKGNEPAGIGDWYGFHASDTPETNTDSFHVRVQFLDNPGETYAFDVYWTDCDPAHRICTETTDVEWYTDFSDPTATTGWPTLPLPSIHGGGESDCRPDSGQVLTPADFSDDTSASSHRCTDNSANFYVRVYVAPDKKPICSAYKLEVSNGVY